MGGLLLLFAWQNSLADRPASGTIAYIRTNKTTGEEIRLIEPDGSHDRLLWKLPNVCSTGVTGLAWRPDGKELAFASDHAASYSLYESDIYALQPDGRGVRKLTNGPEHSELKSLPKGSMTVTLQNLLPDDNLFLIYVAGAWDSEQIVIPSRSSKTVTIKNVADFGNLPHWVSVVSGDYRWLFPGPVVHANQTASVGPLTLRGTGMKHFDATGPVWKSDGKSVAFILARNAGLYSISSSVAPGSILHTSLIGGKEQISATVYDLGPPPALANQILYGGGTGDSAIYRTTEGSGQRGSRLVEYDSTELLLSLQWLPDGSGFLFAKVEAGFSQSNLYRYDFATKQVKALTRFGKEFAGVCCIAPDGQNIVFERNKTLDGSVPTDLWIMHKDGSTMRLLIKHGAAPAWGRASKP